MWPSESSFLGPGASQGNQAKIEARHYMNELMGANQTLAAHGLPPVSDPSLLEIPI
jgi:hypothetical protein